jgi:signal transduction histidine kinase/PAS domain-containing protein/ActR/RegA family two-component response regulator
MMDSGNSTSTAPATAAGRFIRPVLLLTVVALLLALCWLLYHLEAARIINQQQQRETTRVSLLAELMRSRLQPITVDLKLLATSDGLQAFLDGGSTAGLQAAARLGQFVSANHPAYDQVRYIDQTGQEVLRFNRGGEAIPAPQLQNKAARGYFQKAVQLTPGMFYVSALDLNVEAGQVEKPLKPMLRLAAPVFDNAGQRRGIVVINYLATDLYDYLQHAIPAVGGRLRLLDANGYWLKAEDPAMEWGFMLPERSAFNLARSDPDLWANISADLSGHRLADTLFTWIRMGPAELIDLPVGQVVSDMPGLIIAAQVSRQDLLALTSGLRNAMSIVVPALMLLTLFSAWLLRARRNVLVELRTMNHQLENRVRERTVELQKSNEGLQYREDLLEETGQLAKVGGWEFDPATGEGTWTPEIARIHDVPVTMKPSKDIGLQFYPGESRARIEAAVSKSLADGSPYDLELEFVSATGARKWVRTISRPVLQDGRVVRMRGALQDITDRKLTELRLHTQLQRMHLLERTTRAIGERQDLASILQVVIRTLEEQLPLDFCCACSYDAVERGLTVTAVGAASSALAQALMMREQARIPIDGNGLARCVQGHLVHEADVASVQFPFPQRLAQAGLGAMVAAPLQIESRVFGVLIAARRASRSFSSGDCEFLRQLSEHVALAAHQAELHDALKRAYDDLRSTQQAVMQQERLRVLGQMASGIAHDINNAISPVVLYSDTLLESEPGLSNRTRQGLQIIQRAVGDVAATVARMREFYRKGEPEAELQVVDVNAVVMQIPDLSRARWETMPQQKGIVIDLRLELAEHLPPVLGLESEMREALINLVFNAVDAMPSGGLMVIRTKRGADDHVDVEVIDSGTGMDEETRRRCLEPFFSTKGERGTGLGLAMVYGVMQRNGGQLDIDSSPGAGTTMRLSFVVADIEAPDSTRSQLVVPAGLTILLVDDDLILLNSLREVLELDGHTIIAMDGGQRGIEAFRESLQQDASPVSVVITDLGMPHVDGRAVARAVKLASPATPVILLTGWGERLLAEDRSLPNIDRVLGKPPRIRDLRNALAELTRLH